MRPQSTNSSAKVTIVCPQCGTEFVRFRSLKATFCSRDCANAAQRAPLAERFWEKVAPPNDNGCRLWTAGTFPAGYGQIRVGGVTRPAHIVAWELATGDAPGPGQVVGHTCDNKRCVRNDGVGTYVVNGVELPRRGHLFLGTAADNVADRDAKGRTARRCPLSQEQVADVRRRYHELPRYGAIVTLAREFGVSKDTILNAVHRPYKRRWTINGL